MSSHSVEVVAVKVEPVPTADSLGLVRIGGYQTLVRKDDWKDGDLGAFVPPDSVVDGDRPEFAFLGAGKKHRVRAKKLRGVISHGLLVPAPAGSSPGDDVAEALGVEHWDPPVPGEGGSKYTGGPSEKGPELGVPVYDLENLKKYPDILREREFVIVTEKIHGANARYVNWNGKIYAGSRKLWKAETEESIWWKALRAAPNVRHFLEQNPGTIVYGEVYGRVQSLRYGLGEEVRLAVFDLYRYDSEWQNSWIPPMIARHDYAFLPWVPELYRGLYSYDLVTKLAEGKSMLADHLREGCVVEPAASRFDPRIGRVKLKVVSDAYLTGKHE